MAMGSFSLVDDWLERERCVLARLIDLLDFQLIAVDGQDMSGKHRGDGSSSS